MTSALGWKFTGGWVAFWDRARNEDVIASNNPAATIDDFLAHDLNFVRLDFIPPPLRAREASARFASVQARGHCSQTIPEVYGRRRLTRRRRWRGLRAPATTECWRRWKRAAPVPHWR